MRAFAIARKELYSLFVTPTAYFIVMGFVFLSAYFFFSLLGSFNVLISQYAAQPYGAADKLPNINQWIIEPYFQAVVGLFIFVIPVLTMGLIAQERQQGTMEMLVTSPVSTREIVVGKFLALASFLVILSLCAGVFPGILGFFGKPEWPPIIIGIFGICLYAIALGAIGLAVSACCSSQLLAGGLSAFVLLLVFVIHSPAESFGGASAEVLYAISPAFQVREFVRGVFSLDAVILFFSLSYFSLYFAEQVVDSERGR